MNKRKKNWKKAFSILLASALVLQGMSALAAETTESETTVSEASVETDAEGWTEGTGTEDELYQSGTDYTADALACGAENETQGENEESDETAALNEQSGDQDVTAASDSIITYETTGVAGHIDIGIAAEVSLTVGSQVLTQQVNLTVEDVAAASITAVQGDTAVSFYAYTDGIWLREEAPGVIQANIPGGYPVGTKENPVRYTVTIPKTVTFVDETSGAEYTRTIQFGGTFSYWEQNSCPVALAALGFWEQGFFIPYSGLDYMLGCTTDSMGYVTVQKSTLDSEGNPVNTASAYEFDLFTESGEYVTTLNVPVGEDGFGSAGTAVEYGSYYIVEREPAYLAGDYIYSGTVISAGGSSVAGTASAAVMVGAESSTAVFSVVNTYQSNNTAFTVNKVWEDGENQDGIRSASVSVQLFKNGAAYGEPAELTAESGWAYTWTGLKSYENGEKVVYTAAEVGTVDGYEVSYNEDTSVITNTHVPAQVTVEGSKIWEDADNKDAVRPENITVRLLANGTEAASKTVSAADNWTWSFQGLSKYQNGEEIIYTITEDPVEGYTTEIRGYDIVNTQIIPGNASITVVKETINILTDEPILLSSAEFYIGLFADAEMTVPAAEPQKVVFDGTSSSAQVVFAGLKEGTYYVAEVNSQGKVITSGECGGGAFTPGYPVVDGAESQIVELKADEQAVFVMSNDFVIPPVETEAPVTPNTPDETETPAETEAQTEELTEEETESEEETEEVSEPEDTEEQEEDTEAPANETKEKDDSSAVNTGDETPVLPLMIALLVSAAVVLLALMGRMKKRRA